ncbi:response regulator [Fibrella forsythiae]|uniref:Response regulator n=1 Tax=Fibrella forsythiae TaxID=2817061 RepID=A0ABS3JG14_9BACT|nr:response regulator [Fibrella forsythiae]MBO0948951.1 response regulator [Fibrella forsythiae]
MNLLVVEDEAILAMTLCDHLEAEGYRVVGIANNGLKAIDLFQHNQVDLLLCDITIKGEFDGIETARRINAIRNVPVIYLTAYSDSDTVSRAKQTFPAAYLTKPYDIMNLRLAIEIALNNGTRPTSASPPPATPAVEPMVSAREMILKSDQHIFIRQGYQFVKVNLSDIHVLVAEDIYTTFLTATKKYSLRMPLTTVLDKLDYPKVVRVHRSYAVNTSLVDTFDENEIRVAERLVPLGRHYKDQFLQSLHQST